MGSMDDAIKEKLEKLELRYSTAEDVLDFRRSKVREKLERRNEAR